MALRLATITICLLLVFEVAAHAVCGDVNGDSRRTATDALAVLRSAVGLDVELTSSCEDCSASATSTTIAPTTSLPPTTTTLPTSDCGNGIVEPGETCDLDCPDCPASRSCFSSDGGSAETCDLECGGPILTCSGATPDNCCPYVAEDAGCSSVSDADCGGTGWQFIQWFQPISWASQCAVVSAYGIEDGANYVFTTCHPAGGTSTIGDPVITSVVDNLGRAYEVGNDDCNQPSALPSLAGWECDAGDACTSNNSGGFVVAADPGVSRLDVTICGVGGTAGTASLWIWYQASQAPNAG